MEAVNERDEAANRPWRPGLFGTNISRNDKETGRFVKIPIAQRFWAKVKKTDTCWEWIGVKDSHGYGRVSIGHRGLKTASRVSWEISKGPIPDGLFVLHKCDNPPCVRPEHLFLGTHLDNVLDCKAKGRQNHPRGEKNGVPKLTVEKVLEIRSLRESGLTFRAIGSMYGIAHRTVQNIDKRIKWSHVPAAGGPKEK